jgi:hypothetical protein
MAALLICTTLPAVAAESSSSRQLRGELWALPFEFPTLACLVRPLGAGPFPLVVVNDDHAEQFAAALREAPSKPSSFLPATTEWLIVLNASRRER